MSSSNGVVRTMLTRDVSRKLEDLVKEHEAEIQAGKWSMPTFSEFAGRRLTRPITPSNVKCAARVMGIEFPNQRSRSQSDNKEDLKNMIRIIAKELDGLIKELGYEPEDEFQEMLKGL